MTTGPVVPPPHRDSESPIPTDAGNDAGHEDRLRPSEPVVSRKADLPWGMVTKSPDPAPEGPNHSRQQPGKEHRKDSDLRPGSQKVSRRQTLDEGLKYVLVHDAELLVRLADA